MGVRKHVKSPKNWAIPLEAPRKFVHNGPNLAPKTNISQYEF